MIIGSQKIYNDFKDEKKGFVMSSWKIAKYFENCESQMIISHKSYNLQIP